MFYTGAGEQPTQEGALATTCSCEGLLRRSEAATGFIELQPRGRCFSQFISTGGFSQLARPFSSPYRFGKVPPLRIGGSQGVLEPEVGVTAEPTGPLGQAHRLRSIPRLRLGMGSQHPRQVVQYFFPVRAQRQRGPIFCDRL